MKQISVLTACYNEEENVAEVYRQVKELFAGPLRHYAYEHVFIDNASTDRTVPILKELAARDRNVKIIVNSRNFGHIRSPFYGLLQCRGEAVISLVADLQDPPELIVDLVRQWEAGAPVVVGVKKGSREARWMFALRGLYYRLIGALSEIEQVRGFTGFGLYDKKVIEILRRIDDPYPYFRGLISEIGLPVAQIEYTQPARRRGRTKNNFYSLYDMAMLGITGFSKVPLRLATMFGFAGSVLCLLVAIGYFVYKLLFWKEFRVGVAPMVIGLFLFASVQLFFIGIIGEYIGAIHTQVLKRPLVIEKERVNF